MSDIGVHNLARYGTHNLYDSFSFTNSDLFCSKPDFEKALTDAGDALVVLDCFATWCGPCKVIAPKVVQMAQQFESTRFYKIDVDEVNDVASELGIRAMPTFLLFKNGEKIEEIVGANEKALRAAIEKHK
jgi:thioredoxin 1